MSDTMKAVDPFFDRIPRELHEQYLTDVFTEVMKMAEPNKTTDDSVILVTYAIIVAFARKL